jgi:hypothetical protein
MLVRGDGHVSVALSIYGCHVAAIPGAVPGTPPLRPAAAWQRCIEQSRIGTLPCRCPLTAGGAPTARRAAYLI